MNYLKKFAVGIAAIIAAANSLGYMPYNPVDLPVLTAEAADIVASGECGAEGDNVKWQLDSEGTLTISGEGEMKRFSYSSPAPWKTESIKKLVVENGVTNIVKEAFADCSSLTSVTIADSVTTIGEAAFKNCSSLTLVNIPEGVTAIKSLTFEGCSELTSIVIPDSVTSIESAAFRDCSNLKDISIPDSVTTIGGASFARTPWLEIKKSENPYVIVNNILIDGTACKGDITIPDNVVCIADYSFQANLELTSATIPDSITNIGNSIFSYCSNLTSVKIPNSITAIPGAMFENCQKLNKITLPESIKTIGTNAFFNCSELNSITIENSECVIEDSEKTICNTYDISTKETGFTGTIYGYPNSTAQAYAEKYNRKFVALEEKPAAEIVASGDCGAEGDNVKWQLDSEGTLTISGEGEMKNYDFEEDAPWYREYYQEGGVTKVIIEDGVTSIGDMAFNECVYLTSITIPDSVTSIGFRAFYWTALDSVTIPDSVTTIGEDAFSGCSKLDTITIPDSVTAIGNNAFEQTPWLEIRIAENPLVTVNNILIDGTACKGDITIPENITHIVTSAFSKSEELTAIYVDENNKNYTSENGVLFNKNKTTLVSYPIGNTAKEYTIPDGVVNIEDEAFFRCENLTSVIIPDGVKNIGNYAFYWCNGLLSVDISDTVESIGEYAFNNCNDLISIKIPDSVTSLGMAAVSSCYGLETAEIGNGVRKIDDYTFSYCKNLTFVTIGNNVEHIGELAFQACQKLESVTIPDSVISIGNSAFKGCSSLSSIEIPANVETIDKYAFESCDGLKSITIYNPDCFIDSDMYDTLYSTAEIATIYGYKGSTAQSYARDNKLDFIALDEEKPAVEIVASGECGEEGYDLTWSLDSKGTLTISGTGEMDSWALNSPWSEHSDKITKVIIENGVTTIGEQAFSGCKKIAEISIPDSVTNIKTGAFFDCTGLTSIKIPESVTEMGHSVFYGCVNLKEVTLPSGIGTINTGVFRDCQSLETITFSKNVTKVDFTALCGCSNLKSVIFEHPGCKIADAEHTICNSHDFDTEENVFNGTIYGYENSTAQAYAEKYNRTFVALEGKPAIEIIDSGECGVMEEDGVFWMFDSEGTLTISGAGGSMYFHDDNIPWGKYQKDIVKVVVEKGVTGIEVAAFSYCTNLKSVTISSDVMYIGPYAFSGCTSLESIVIPDGVTDIEYSTFKDCKNLTSITLPESIIEIGHSAFEGCEKLASITLKNPECVIDDVKNTIPDTTVIYGCKNSNVQAYAEKYNIKFVALDEKPAVEIVASGECGAEGDNVKWQLDSEGTLTISGTGEMSTTYFGEQELGKDENGIIPVDIKKVVIEDGVTSISGTAFNGYRMNEIEIADSVTSIGKFAFYNCPNLTEITLPKNLKEISLYAFTDCTALENITIPASVAVIGENPFYGCTSLNKIIVEDNNSDYVSVDGVLYTKDMTRIISYPIGKTLTEYNIPYTVKEIGGGAFCCETDLTNITIPDSVTYIGEEAFSECNGITSITIPKNVANIGEYTFFKCSALEKIVIENPDCAIYDYSYTICNTAKSLTGADSKYQGNYDGTIYGYPNSTAQAYAEKYNIKFVALDEKPAAAELGDVNSDGKVDSSDASLVLEEYAVIQTGGAGAFTENQKKAADVNKDGKTDSSDASKILEYYAMISTGKEPTWD